MRLKNDSISLQKCLEFEISWTLVIFCQILLHDHVELAGFVFLRVTKRLLDLKGLGEPKQSMLMYTHE